MANQFAVRVINARKVPFAPMACDVAFGFTDKTGKFIGVASVPDFILKKTDKGWNYNEPSKPHIKNGEIQKDENGYDKYIKFFRLYAEEGAGKDGGFGVTNAAWEFRKHLIQLMVDAYEALGGDSATSGAASGSKPAKPAARRQAAKPAPTAAATVIDEDEVGSPGEDEDDGFPF